MSASIVISDFPSRRATLVTLFSEIGDITNTEVTTNYANRVQPEDKPPNAVTVWDELLFLGKMLAEAQGLETQHRPQLLRRDQESHGNHGKCCISYLSDPCEQNRFLYFSETAKSHAHPLTKPTTPSPTPPPRPRSVGQEVPWGQDLAYFHYSFWTLPPSLGLECGQLYITTLSLRHTKR